MSVALDYQRKFDSMTILRGAAVEAAAQRIMRNWDQYKRVEKLTGVPAYFVGALHDRECACNLKGCLHNGQLINGTQRKTTLEPKGHGPFKDFIESAVHALKLKGMLGRTWTTGEILEYAERFNGLGYRNHGYSNPYLWGGTQWYTRGKYVRDHVYNGNFVDPQVGVGPVMKRVLELTGGRLAPAWKTHLTEKGKLHPADKKAIVKNSRALRWGEWYTNFCEYLGLSGAGLAALIPTVASFLTDWRTLIVAAILGGGYVLMQLNKFNLLNAAKNSRYVPSGFWNVGQPVMADGPTVSAVPPQPEADAPALDAALVDSPPAAGGVGTATAGGAG